MAETARNPIRILCLHGYRQSGETFREKTGAFRKLLKNKAEFTFIDAPLVVPSEDDSEKESEGRGWWFSREDNFFSAHHKSTFVKGFEDSLLSIEKCFKELGPFDGILGFSQGGAMAALICVLQQKKKLSFKFKFAILVSAFCSQSTPHLSLYTEEITLPTLHVYGETDKVIPKAMSEDLMKHFILPQSLLHPGGHFIPATGAHKSTYMAFIASVKELT